MTVDDNINHNKKINQELFRLNPSTLVTLFEIDVTDLMLDKQITQGDGVFRFHNNVKLFQNSIIWGPEDNEYYAAPIRVEGFEINGRGTQPTPKLSLSVEDENVAILSILKQRILQLGDLSGAKVTRIRTFAKFLNKENWGGQVLPDGYAEDKYAELPRDIYYIDRKSNENKNSVEYDLASILDIEGVKLPGRIILAERCPFEYRGEGCGYEYNDARTFVHEEMGPLPPYISTITHWTENDENIDKVLASLQGLPATASIPPVLRGLYNKANSYVFGDMVRIQKSGINYYFVCKVANATVSPPDSSQWISEKCSKRIKGCRIRFGQENLPFGGYYGLNRKFQ